MFHLIQVYLNLVALAFTYNLGQLSYLKVNSNKEQKSFLALSRKKNHFSSRNRNRLIKNVCFDCLEEGNLQRFVLKRYNFTPGNNISVSFTLTMPRNTF